MAVEFSECQYLCCHMRRTCCGCCKYSAAIRAFAVSMALELDVNVDRAERAVRNLIARGLIDVE